MGDTLKKVQPGQRMVIPAQTFNTFIDAARDYLQRRQNQGGDPLAEPRQAGVILVRNDTGEDRALFDILGLDGPVYGPEDNEEGFKFRYALKGVASTAADHAGNFAICLEPIADGKIGRCLVQGVTPVKLNVLRDDHGFADVVDDGRLSTAPEGAAQVLWKEDGTGEDKWALVRVAEAPPQAPFWAEITADGGGAYEWVEVEWGGAGGSQHKSGGRSSDTHGPAYEVNDFDFGASDINPVGQVIQLFAVRTGAAEEYWFHYGPVVGGGDRESFWATIALYGKSAVGDRLSDKSYHEHLRGLVHRSRNSLIQFNYARVGVEFDFVFHGKRDTYYVQRCWTLRTGNGVQESLQVYKRDDTSQDGDYNSWPTLADLAPEHWQAFVSDVVPERLSQLFFFDGEKIRRIADDISGDTAIAESVRSLLGLDTVVRLKADLAILATREAKQHMASDDAGALTRAEAEIEAIQTSLDALSQGRAELETSIRGVEGEIKRLETQLQEQGGVFAQGRPAKQSRQAVLESEIQNSQRQIRQECEGLYPLALCPTIACRLEAQIESEAHLRRNTLLRKDVEALKAQLIHNLSSSCNLKVKPVRQEVIRIVQDTFAHHMEGPTACAGCDLLGLSEVDAGRVLDWLREAREGAAETMRRLCSEIEAKEREAQGIRRQLDKAPEQMVLASVFGDLSIQNKLLGQRQAELKSLDEKATTLKNELAAREREKLRLEEKGRE